MGFLALGVAIGIFGLVDLSPNQRIDELFLAFWSLDWLYINQLVDVLMFRLILGGKGRAAICRKDFFFSSTMVYNVFDYTKNWEYTQEHIYIHLLHNEFSIDIIVSLVARARKSTIASSSTESSTTSWSNNPSKNQCIHLHQRVVSTYTIRYNSSLCSIHLYSTRVHVFKESRDHTSCFHWEPHKALQQPP